MTVQQHAMTQTVLVYEDDPGPPLQENVPVRHPVPQLDTQPFPTVIAEAVPQPDSAGPGTPAFRYWVAADALSTGCQTWGPLVPTGTQWVPSVGRVLSVHLDEGVDLNAFYDRRSLKFFHQRVEGVDVFSGGSPEIVRHELGHAVLDALRPQLWNAAMHEADALHEAFGDISALLTALQMESLRTAVLTHTQGRIEQSSRMSRLAEQLGWALDKVAPGAAEPDCLRNMSNRFFYRDPVELPPSGPANMLTSGPHSFSRVFSGAFLKIVAGIFRQQDSQDQAALAEAGRIAGQLLVDAVVAAPVVAGYYAQVAGHMIAADQRRHSGRYGTSLRSAFTRHGILSLNAATSLTAQEIALQGAAMAEATPGGRDEDGLTAVTVQGAGYGITGPLTLYAPGESRRFGVAGSDPAGGSVRPADPEQVATSYLEDLLRRGRVEIPAENRSHVAIVDDSPRLKTHEIVRSETADGLALVRRCFD
ncbi:hypothetical protein OG250_01395 [Streptomyces sp. NBC_00487]|uniref:hypothetical protein n=1 Tax=unclassified Streptomyces TaxID=2593676 RepID=UPI002DD7A9DA|nr:MULTISPECIES: hypothetical protein [unclassified Streptomyces]WRY93707.1 hypothetical protein OG889_02600 [Streptomyces sp. NBC_00481]